ncbi:MAG: hypothetical protein ACTSVO_13610 [Candidatus Heimdallarchaeaceae archaeon]
MIRDKRKGRILKIKKGYNPNCSSGIYLLIILIFFVPTILGGGALFAFISSKLSKMMITKHFMKYGKKKVEN